MDDKTPMTKYVMKTTKEEVCFEVPTTWKITFAGVNPAMGKGGYNDAWCVRVYEMPGSRLRAVFDSVVSIRDVSIPLMRKVTTQVGNSQWTRDSIGNFSETTENKVTHELVADTFADTFGEGEF